MTWTDEERDRIIKLLVECWPTIGEAGVGLYLARLEVYPRYLVEKAILGIWSSQDPPRKPGVKPIVDHVKANIPKKAAVADTAPRYTWDQFKERVKGGQVYIPDEQMAAFNWLDGLLKGRVTGMAV